MTTGTRQDGDFCWINMLTPEPAAARDFFGALLGWTYAEIPGVGHAVKVAGRDIGGLFDLNGPNTPPGTPPIIGVMVKVASADAAGEKVRALGGKATPAFDIMGQGRMAVCHDPNGANFDVWEPRKMSGTDLDSHHHGAPTWFETITSDVGRATAFYAALFGWTADTKPMPGMTYTTFSLGTTPIAGLMQITPAMGKMAPHWGVYFAVTNARDAERQAASLGATIMIPGQDIPDVGRFCGIVSPQGVMFYLLEYTA